MCTFKHVQEQRVLVTWTKPWPWPHVEQWRPCGLQLHRPFKVESKHRFAAHYHALKHLSLLVYSILCSSLEMSLESLLVLCLSSSYMIFLLVSWEISLFFSEILWALYSNYKVVRWTSTIFVFFPFVFWYLRSWLFAFISLKNNI